MCKISPQYLSSKFYNNLTTTKIAYQLLYLPQGIKKIIVDRLKHGIGADQDFFMLYYWYRKNIHDMNKCYKLTILTVTFLTLLNISRC